MREVFSTLKKKKRKAQAGNEWSIFLPKSSQTRGKKKGTTTPPPPLPPSRSYQGPYRDSRSPIAPQKTVDESEATVADLPNSFTAAAAWKAITAASAASSGGPPEDFVLARLPG